jgi:hypothetical protein
VVGHFLNPILVTLGYLRITPFVSLSRTSFPFSLDGRRVEPALNLIQGDEGDLLVILPLSLILSRKGRGEIGT